MTHSPFVFSSENLPRLKARQLHKAFPFLKLSAIQEATVKALGYSSWYDCKKHGTTGDPSLSDQEAGMAVRVIRYCHQASVLISLGITPFDADLWVRAWGLTGSPTFSPEEATPLYYRWSNALDQLDLGEITEEEFMDAWGEHDGDKYPEIDRPQRICDSVILGPIGSKYPHYMVDPAINAQIPIFLRGPIGAYHLEDDGAFLEEFVPDFPKSEPREVDRSLLRDERNRVHHEWRHGEKHPRAKLKCLSKLIAAARSKPDAMVVISQRAMPTPDGGYDFERYAVACLSGKDFAAFIQSKGSLDTSKVVWYRDIPRLQFGMWLDNGYESQDIELPVFTEAEKHTPGLPLYSYPFMTAPMSTDEYHGFTERTCLLPLDEDYKSSDDEDEDDSDDGPPQNPSWGPDDPTLEAEVLKDQKQGVLM